MFITLALLNRFLQGFSSSLIQTTMYSICTNFFPDDKDAMVGYIEAVTGVGLILGPLLGSGLYSIGGYIFIFYSFGSIFLLFSFFVRAIFGEEVDKMGVKSAKTSRQNSFASRRSPVDVQANSASESRSRSRSHDDSYVKS